MDVNNNQFDNKKIDTLENLVFSQKGNKEWWLGKDADGDTATNKKKAKAEDKEVCNDVVLIIRSQCHYVNVSNSLNLFVRVHLLTFSQ